MFTEADIDNFYNIGISYQKVKELNKTRELSLSFRDKVKSLYNDKDDDFLVSLSNLNFNKNYAILECVKGSPLYKTFGARTLCYYGTLDEKTALVKKIKANAINAETGNEKATEFDYYKAGFGTIEFYTVAFANILVTAIKKDLEFLNQPTTAENIKKEMKKSLPFLNKMCEHINNSTQYNLSGVFPAIKMNKEERRKTHAETILKVCMEEEYGLDAFGNVCRLSEGYFDKFKLSMKKEYNVFNDTNRMVMCFETIFITQPEYETLVKDTQKLWDSRGELKQSPLLFDITTKKQKEANNLNGESYEDFIQEECDEDFIQEDDNNK